MAALMSSRSTRLRPLVIDDGFPGDSMPAHSRRSAVIRWRGLALTAGLALGACSSSTSPSAGPTITIRDFSFSPSTLTVKPGTTVEWLNDGPSSHTTTSDAALWDSAP